MAQVNESGAMTGQQLLDLLKQMDPEALAQPIHFAYPAGDYWKSEIAAEVHQVYEGNIYFSDYHTKFNTLDENKLDEAERKLREAIAEGEEPNLDDDGTVYYNGQPVLKALIIT